MGGKKEIPDSHGALRKQKTLWGPTKCLTHIIYKASFDLISSLRHWDISVTLCCTGQDTKAQKDQRQASW